MSDDGRGESRGQSATPAGSADRYRVVVALSNPRTGANLVAVGATMAAQHDDGVVHAVHVVEVPDQTPLERGRERVDESSRRLLERAREHVEAGPYGDVEIETSTIVSHRGFEGVFDAARRRRADLVVMGWGAERAWGAGRAERPMGELAGSLPFDVLVLEDREFDASRILLPTAGGPDSDLAAEAARAIRAAVGSEITLLHVVDGQDARPAGEQFLANWAAEHGFGEAVLTVDHDGDVEGAIEREAADHSLVLLGATERGLLPRLVSDSLHMQVVDDVDCSVLLAERPTRRSLRERLFGRGRRAESGNASGSADASE